MTDPTQTDKAMLRIHFGFSRMPFSKYRWAQHMYDSVSQRELTRGLHMWTEVRGLALVTGPSGVGKSITLRRFTKELSTQRFRVFELGYMPSTVYGFLRALARHFELRMRSHTADLFDAVQRHLFSHIDDHGTHPVLVIDDGEGLSIDVLDALRRLTCYELDAEDRFSVLLSGTDDLMRTLRVPSLVPLRSRVTYAHQLRPFGLDDTRNYIRHQLDHADADRKLFSEEAVKRLFHTSQGIPRYVNQLALQALIQAVVHGNDTIDGDFMAKQIAAHPLYQATGDR